jgi:diaminopimelate epimerase
MSGSGNDFIFFDAADGPTAEFQAPEVIQRLCARGTGVGADGVVLFSRANADKVAIRYYNADGSAGELCGNATLCSVRLAELLGTSVGSNLTIDTDTGDVAGRLIDGLPEIDLEPVTLVQPSYSAIPLVPPEKRMGFAEVGVPHVVLEVDDVSGADVLGRGSRIRRDRSLAAGANVNFLSPASDGSWRVRTYERGVEGETLACGTGAVASAIMLVEWGKATSPVRLTPKSGRALTVRLQRNGSGWNPSLRGNAELVFIGELP